MTSVAILSLALTAFTAGDPPGGFQGTWDWGQTLADGKEATWTLNLRQQGAEVDGVLLFSAGASTPIKGGKVVDGELSFRLEREVGSRTLTSLYKARRDGKSLKGAVQPLIEGGGREAKPWKGDRVDEPDGASKFVGAWRQEFASLEDGTITTTITFRREGGKLVGTYHVSLGPSKELYDVNVEDGRLTFFSRTKPADGRTPVTRTTCALAGDTLLATTEHVRADGTIVEQSWEMTRVKPPAKPDDD